MLRRVLVEGGSIRVDSVQGAALGGNLEELYRSTELRQAAELVQPQGLEAQHAVPVA